MARDLVAYLLTMAVTYNELADSLDIRLFDRVHDRTGHRGSKSRRIDHLMERQAKRWLENCPLFGEDGFLLYGEESSTTSDLEGQKPILIQADVIDGTTNMAIAQRDWSVVVLTHMWSRGNKRYVPCGGAIGLADLQIVWWSDITRSQNGRLQYPNGQVWTQRVLLPEDFPRESDLRSIPTPHLSESRSVPDPLPNRPEDDAVVTVAAASKSRRNVLIEKYPHLISEASYLGLTAGTPIVIGALKGQLGAIVEFEATSLHDSAHLIPLAMVGWNIELLEAQNTLPISELLWENLLPGSAETPIPAYLAYRSDEARDFVRR
jgi:hypothetical protein